MKLPIKSMSYKRSFELYPQKYPLKVDTAKIDVFPLVRKKTIETDISVISRLVADEKLPIRGG